MAGSKSDAFENLILAHALGSVAWTPPASVYVGLWTAALADASTGATAGEVSGGSYARVAVANNQTNWGTAAGGTVKNQTVINFGTASAGWGTVTDFALLNAAASGTILYYGTLTQSKIIQTNDPVSFAALDLVITES